MAHLFCLPEHAAPDDRCGLAYIHVRSCSGKTTLSQNEERAQAESQFLGHLTLLRTARAD
jgi:hypothetical protein